MDFETIKNEIYGKIETQLKPIIGDLWYEFRDDALSWAKIVARLEVDIASGAHPLTNQIIYDHVMKIGIPSFVQRLRGRVEDYAINFFKSLLQFLLDAAIAAAQSFLKEKFGL